jgi:hypothetical protein
MRFAMFSTILFSTILVAAYDRPSAAAGFAWQDGTDETTLTYDGRPALQFIRPVYDDATPDTIQNTFKPYHHVFSPDGETRLTKGPGGLYPHHRALFFGFNKVTYDGDKQCDIWHCTNGTHQQFVKDIHREADDKHAQQRVAIDWIGLKGDLFAHEERELSITRPAIGGVDGWMIDFSSHVASADGKPIHLDGDPQHAGFHFRADQEDIKNTAAATQEKEKQTYFIRTDGKGKIDEARNWDPKSADSDVSKDCVNRPWDAMSFELHGKRYTVLYLDHPSNPKPARYSERAYGRFGSYFVTDVTESLPLNVKYRVWVQPGEMTQEQCEKLSAEFNSLGAVLPSSGATSPLENPGRERSRSAAAATK